MLFCYEDDIQKFKTLNFNCFCGQNGILYDSMGCLNKPNDMLHLGSLGIIKLATLIKDCLKDRKVSQGSSYANITKGITLSPKAADSSSVES